MGTRNKPTKELLKELCIAHSQLVIARKEHSRSGDISRIVLETYDQKIQELQQTIAIHLKTWLGLEQS
jgi:hypothetical protein